MTVQVFTMGNCQFKKSTRDSASKKRPPVLPVEMPDNTDHKVSDWPWLMNRRDDKAPFRGLYGRSGSNVYDVASLEHAEKTVGDEVANCFGDALRTQLPCLASVLLENTDHYSVL